MEQTLLDKITLQFYISKPKSSVPKQQIHSLRTLNQWFADITSVAHHKTHAVQNTGIYWDYEDTSLCAM